MAINDTQTDNTGNAQGTFGVTSLHGGALFGAPISRGLGSEIYTKVKEGLLAIYKEANSDVKIAVIDLDNVNNPTLDFSSIVIAVQLKANPNVGVAYHILTLEGTGEQLTPYTENINGRNVEVLRVTSDAIDATLLKLAAEKVERFFPGVPSMNVDGTVVPNTFNPEDKLAMHKLALSAGLACTTELYIHVDGFRDLNLTTLPSDNGSLSTNLSFNQGQIENTVGQPVRSSVIVNFSSRRNTGNNRQAANQGDREQRISKASGFLDLVWAPRDGGQGFNPWMTQQQVAGQAANPLMTQKYAARLVLTDIQSDLAYTPSVVLLSVATALTASDSNNWFQAYRPTPSAGKGLDLNDIGALNIEANIANEQDKGGFGTRIATKGADFQLSQLGQLIGTLVQPGMMLAIDCPEYGPQSWYLSVFAAAAAGRQSAYEAVYNAANDLTNGAFGRYFPQGTQMFVDTGNRVHLGHWTDRTGQKRDLRDWDHLAVVNALGETNPQGIRDFSDTYLRTEYPLLQRLEARKRIISSLSGETAVFTGFANRVTFSRQFLQALSSAVRETCPPVRVTTPLSNSDLNNARGVASWAEGAMLTPGMTFQAAGGYGGYQGGQQAGYYGNGGGRW